MKLAVREGSTPSPRRLVFISHANPQDNEVTLWLASRLAAAGYEVWSDLTKLIGGELFWSDIEVAIREHSAKFVSLVSKSSVAKPGFLDELSVATAAERTAKLGDFVIPCRVDDFDFASLPALMHRKNVIDLTNGWHIGLGKLLEKLTRDNVPRRASVSTDQLSRWSREFLNVDANLKREQEVVLSNWLPLRAWPASVRIAIRDAKTPLARETWPWPVAPTIDLGIASFAPARELIPAAGPVPKVIREVPFETFLADDDMARGGLNGYDARRIVADLIRQAWDRFCKRRGLMAAELSNGRLCWYWPLREDGSVSVAYVDLDGQRRKKRLMGRSDKRRVYWHYAIESCPVLAEPSRVVLVSHVVFTEDGSTPLQSSARAHQLRRSFCKNWWQWQWRELLLASIARLKGDEDILELPVASDAAIALSTELLRFAAPVSSTVAVSPEEDMDEPLPTAEHEDDSPDDEDTSIAEEFEAEE